MHWHNGPKTSWRGRMNFSKSLPLDLPPSFFKSYTPENSHTTQKMTLWTFPTSKRGDVFFSSMLQVVFWEVFQYGGFLKWWYPTTMGFPTKNDHFGVFWGYPYFWKYPYIHSPVSPQLLQLGTHFQDSKLCEGPSRIRQMPRCKLHRVWPGDFMGWFTGPPGNARRTFKNA